MKKDILIYTYNLDIGGIERSLIGLLNYIDYNKYNVDLYMFKHEGELIKYIPKKVNILEEEEITKYAGIPIIDIFKRKNLRMGIVRLYAKLKFIVKRNILKQKITGEYISQIVYPSFGKRMRKIEKDYDMALSFYWPHYFVNDNVNAKTKIGWIHTDYNQIYPDKKKELKMWDKLDYVAAVSEDCKKSFLSKYPVLDKKSIVIENLLSTKFVIEQANLLDVTNEIKKQDGVINICSVGRFVEAKNFDNIPKIAKLIIESGIKIKWYLIGFGPYEKIIKEEIKRQKVEEHVIVLGKRSNPYPYIKFCDIYVQPSRFEGKAVTVREAQILNKPVVITNFKTANSQLNNGVDGIIVPLDNEGCAKGIVSLIKDKQLQNVLINNTKSIDYSNSYELEKLYKLM